MTNKIKTNGADALLRGLKQMGIDYICGNVAVRNGKQALINVSCESPIVQGEVH